MSIHSKCFFLWRNKKYHHRIITKYSSDNVGKRKWWLLHVGTIKMFCAFGAVRSGGQGLHGLLTHVSSNVEYSHKKGWLV